MIVRTEEYMRVLARRTGLDYELLAPTRQDHRGRRKGHDPRARRLRQAAQFVVYRKLLRGNGRYVRAAKMFAVDHSTIHYSVKLMREQLTRRNPDYIAAYSAAIRAWLIARDALVATADALATAVLDNPTTKGK